MATLGAGAVWVGAGMPGLSDRYNPIHPPSVVIAAVVPASLPAPPPIDHSVASLAVPPPAAPVVALPPKAPPASAPSARPPMPEVIRPSGGDLTEGQTQSSATASQLPVVIHPSDRSVSLGSGGTGFFIARDGSLITVAHVVRSCNRIVVASRYVKETTAKLLAADFGNDIAVLRADIARPPAVLALADRPYGPESLEIFGYPADGDMLAPTRAHGRLRTERPTFQGMERLDRPDVLWMDANTVRPGFSGGPVLNPNGDVVGLIDGQVMRHTAERGVIVRDTKFVYGSGTRTIDLFLRQETPALVPDADGSLAPEESDKAIVHVICLR
jgi:S1-C subfamily serine protease